MTDPAQLRRRRTMIHVVTTLAASTTGATAVGWAATTPAAQSAPAQHASTQPADERAVVHQLRAARIALERVRRDVTTLMHEASTLPRPQTSGPGPAASSRLGNVYLPPAPVMQRLPVGAPPPANTTTGASGVKP